MKSCVMITNSFGGVLSCIWNLK